MSPAPKPGRTVIKISWLELTVQQYKSTGDAWFWFCNLPTMQVPRPLTATTFHAAKDEALQEFMSQLQLVLNSKQVQRAARRRLGLRRTGMRCAVCKQPQFETEHGFVCKNGHGGADSI